MTSALAMHDHLLRALLHQHCGYEVTPTGSNSSMLHSWAWHQKYPLLPSYCFVLHARMSEGQNVLHARMPVLPVCRSQLHAGYQQFVTPATCLQWQFACLRWQHGAMFMLYTSNL